VCLVIYRFLGLATLREVVFEEVNLEQLQVEFRVEEKTPEMTGTSKNFRQNYDSGSEFRRNLQPRIRQGVEGRALTLKRSWRGDY
jgi:hypothetical protein